MSYNGSGTFQINTSGQPVVTGTVISSSAFNALTADLATGLSTAITKDGQTATTVRIPFAQGINSSLTTDTSSGSTGSIYTAGGIGITKGLFVGGTATFSVAPVFSALTASSAVATDASKNLVSVTNTGTGNNVLATSPTITTPTISQLTSAAATALTLQSAGTTAVTVDTSQRVGIGTTSPDTILNIQGVDPTFLIQDSDESGDGFIKFQTANGTQRAFIQAAMTANVMLLGVGTSEAMRIDSSGNVLVGATSGGGKLSITGTGASGWVQNNINSGTSSTASIVFTNDNGAVGSIVTSGSATSYGTSSDYRLKEDIASMTGALAKVSLLKPVTYKWKIDGTNGQGFIAHELAEVVPQCVIGEKDAVATYIDENGNEAIRPAYQGIDTSFLVATLTAAIQEQQALITSLTDRIVALEAK